MTKTKFQAAWKIDRLTLTFPKNEEIFWPEILFYHYFTQSFLCRPTMVGDIF